MWQRGKLWLPLCLLFFVFFHLLVFFKCFLFFPYFSFKNVYGALVFLCWSSHKFAQERECSGLFPSRPLGTGLFCLYFSCSWGPYLWSPTPDLLQGFGGWATCKYFKQVFFPPFCFLNQNPSSTSFNLSHAHNKHVFFFFFIPFSLLLVLGFSLSLSLTHTHKLFLDFLLL